MPEAVYRRGCQNLINQTAGGARSAGEVEFFGTVAGVWVADCASGAVGTVDVGVGVVYKIKKDESTATTAWDKVDFDTSANDVVADTAGTALGTAVESTLAAATHVDVAINLAGGH